MAASKTGKSSGFTEYFCVRVVDSTVVTHGEDVRQVELRTTKVLYVDRDARLNTSPEGTRLDTEALAETFLRYALPLVQDRHGTAVELAVTRLRATNAMSARWVYQNSWQIRACLCLADPPPVHLRHGLTSDVK